MTMDSKKEVVGRTGTEGKKHGTCPERIMKEKSLTSDKGRGTAWRGARKNGTRRASERTVCPVLGVWNGKEGHVLGHLWGLGTGRVS